jgi:DNA-binding response OmpR family regulator
MSTVRVLHIEDDDLAIRLVGKLCDSAEEVAIEAVHCLTSAQFRLQQEPFDVLLVDLNLPDSVGLDTVEALLEYRIPIIVLTSDPTGEFIDRAVEMGVADYLRKSELPQLNLPLRLHFVHRKHQRQKAAAKGLKFEGLAAIRPYLSCAVLA